MTFADHAAVFLVVALVAALFGLVSWNQHRRVDAAVSLFIGGASLVLASAAWPG